jgi:CBS domain-containing protein
LASTAANDQLVEIVQSTLYIWRDVGAGRPRVARYQKFFEQIECLPMVTPNGTLLGLVTRSDLIRAALL